VQGAQTPQGPLILLYIFGVSGCKLGAREVQSSWVKGTDQFRPVGAFFRYNWAQGEKGWSKIRIKHPRVGLRLRGENAEEEIFAICLGFWEYAFVWNKRKYRKEARKQLMTFYARMEIRIRKCAQKMRTPGATGRYKKEPGFWPGSCG
jgi:hypothetical protein